MLEMNIKNDVYRDTDIDDYRKGKSHVDDSV